MVVRLEQRIPNNVELCSNPSLRRMLEAWQERYLQWWQQMGPEGFGTSEVYLRTAISVERGGWAQFGYTRMSEYRWGIFLAPPVQGRTIGFGENYGKPVWGTVPMDHQSMLLRLLKMQADTEPASVEQQRLLGHTAPSLYDLRNLLQVNVEEGRHLWAMVYLLYLYFGAEGRVEAEAVLERQSGHSSNARLLDTFNLPVETWLDFYMFTMFGDRDGKYQLAALSESGFDPLARTCQFMCTEEAHHLFVGETGINRILMRTGELMRSGLDPAKEGGIPVEVIQRYINHWYPLSLDLFGREVSSNAAAAFNAGIKGRYREERCDDHRAQNCLYPVDMVNDGKLTTNEVPLAQAMNDVLRREYERDCARAVAKWNCTLEGYGQDGVLRLPHHRFNRQQGLYAGHHFNLDGQMLTGEEWSRRVPGCLPTQADQEYVKSLMRGVREVGKVAGWIAPPTRGINGQAFNYEYVRF